MVLFLPYLLLKFLSMWVTSSTHLPIIFSGATNPNIAFGPHHKEGMSLERSEGKDILGRSFYRPILRPLEALSTETCSEKSLDIITFFLPLSLLH